MELLRCNDLSLGYEEQIVAEHVNFVLSKGDYLCIVGENGSGKSTLVKTLLGLQPPISGTIIRSEELQHTAIGYKSGFRPFYSKNEKSLAKEKMERLNIASLAKRCYRELSGGQQQRVLLCRALCATGSVLLLDEPVAGLDPKVTLEMYELIAELNKKDSITIIMVSHDISAVFDYASHVLHVMHGACFFGTKAEYENSEAGSLFRKGEIK